MPASPKNNGTNQDRSGKQAGMKKNIKWTQRSLYAREEPAELKIRQDELHRLGITRHSQQGLAEHGDTLLSTRYKNLALQRARRWGKIISFGGTLLIVIFIVIVAIAALMWYRSRETVTAEQIDLAIEAPTEFTAGEEIIYQLSYHNNSRVDWQNVDLTLYTPRGFDYRGSNQEVSVSQSNITLTIGDIPSGTGGELDVRGQLIGEQNETATAKADLLITPVNFPSGRFLKSAVLASTITTLSLEMGLDIPTEAASGERIVGSVSVRNLSQHALDGIYLNLKPSTNVELALTDKDFTGDFNALQSQWRLRPLPPLASQELTFVFYLNGQPGEKRTLNFEAGIKQHEEDFVQRKLTHILSLSASEVIVEQSYNNSTGPLVVKAGETIEGKVHYSNIGKVGLKDVIIQVKFAGTAFNPSSLRLQGGTYDSAKKTITWSAATVPELAVVQPQQSGFIPYSFTVLPTKQYPSSGEGAKNNIIVSTATVDSPDLPTPVGGEKKVVSDRAVLSVRTDISLAVDALYDDGRLGLKSSGPVPPRVGQRTTYTIRFRAGSSLNDMSNFKMVATLPDGVKYTSSSYKTVGEISFNDRTGQLSWSFPFLAGGTGRTKPPQELHIQVAITPGDQLVSHTVAFLNQVSVEATDQFVDQTITQAIKKYPTTESALPGKGNVQ